MRTCVFVLGMHRSGTSAITGALQKIGVALPQELMPPQADNPKGYFEGVRVMQLNDQFLADLHSNWDDTRFSVSISEHLINKHVDQVKAFIEEEFSYTKIFAIKDPRLCITFPLWEKALLDLGIDVKILLPYRNPFEVAHSLKSRNNFSTEKSLLLWVKYFLQAEKYSRTYPRCFLGFDQFVNNFSKEINKICDFVGIEKESKVIDEIYSEFLDKELKHHSLDLKNVAENIPTFLKKLLGLMESESFNEVASDEFDAIFNEVSSVYQLLHTYDVQFQSQISRDLHAQRDEARTHEQALEQQLSEKQHANEQALNAKTEQLHQLEAEKAQLQQERAEQATQHQAQVKLLEGEKAEQLHQLEAEKAQLEQARSEAEQSQAQLQILEDEKAELVSEREQLKKELESLSQNFEAVKMAKKAQKADDNACINELEQQLVERVDAHEHELKTRDAQLLTLEDQQTQNKQAWKEREGLYKIQLEEIEEEKNKLLKDRAELVKEVQLLTESIDQIVDDLACIKESKCWIYTKPIRHLGRVFKKQDLERQ